MTIHKLDYGKSLTLKRGEGEVFVKYPYEQKYLLSLQSRYKKSKKKYVNKIDAFIPNNGEDVIRYRDGYNIDVLNVESGDIQMC